MHPFMRGLIGENSFYRSTKEVVDNHWICSETHLAHGDKQAGAGPDHIICK